MRTHLASALASSSLLCLGIVVLHHQLLPVDSLAWSSSLPASSSLSSSSSLSRTSHTPTSSTLRATNGESAAHQTEGSSASTTAAVNGSSQDKQAEDDEEQEIQRLNIAFVTGNRMKVRELEMILAEHDAPTRGADPDSSIVNLRIIHVDLPEIQEIDTQAIAKAKAILASQLAGGPCLVEDTSLKFNALGGMPGPYIKWFQEKLKSEGLCNILAAYDDKSAQAVCTLAFCPYPHADPVLFTGETNGTIVEPVPGRGFGWDGIFVPDDCDVPFSCMTTQEKNALSHRGKAVRKWAEWIGVNRDELLARQGGRPAIGHKGLDFKCVTPEQ